MPEKSDFWSRRRRAVAREAARDAQAVETEQAAEADAAAASLEDRTDAELLAHFGLPDPDTLSPADAARFMAREIPARLRRRAIRQLFRGHPHLSMPDGLQDYDHDYTDAAVNLRPDPGAWADLRARAAELARRAADAEAAQDSEPAPAALAEAPGTDGDGEMDGDAVADPQAAAPDAAPDAATIPAAPAGGAAAGGGPDMDEAEPLRPRRMTFHFEENET